MNTIKSNQLVKTSVHSDCILRLTLNNPSHHNALSEEMMSDIQSILDKSVSDKSIRVIIISAEGKSEVAIIPYPQYPVPLECFVLN